jgi:hypothetical protein
VVDAVGSFWWKDILKLTPIFRGITCVQVVDGKTTLFWKDLWKEEILQTSHPRAFSFAILEDLSVAEAMNSTDLHETFHLPVSPQALDEIQDVHSPPHWISPSTSLHDVWHYSWGSAYYKPKDYYNNYFRDGEAHHAFTHLWKSRCTMKIKVFGWLLFLDRLNTRNMLKRRHFNIGDNFDCILCGQHVEETVDHMIFTCPFSQSCWAKLHIVWAPFDSRLDLLQTARDSWPNPFFFETFLTSAWSIWKERNKKHFRGVDPSVEAWLTRFKEDFELLQHRVKAARRAAFVTFCNSIV